MSEFRDFATIPGPSVIDLSEAVHIHIPGRGRNATGDGLSQSTIDRVHMAAALYFALQGAHRDEDEPGFVVPSGYKTPADRNGKQTTIVDELTNRTSYYHGYPEAYSGMLFLVELGVPRKRIFPEINSIDTVTNFVRSEQENHFGKGDRRPVAIIAQQSHLERMMEVIAPKTLRRDYIGVIVPETGIVDVDSTVARVFSRVVSAGLKPESRFAIPRTDAAANLLWGAVLLAQRIKPPSHPYMTEPL